MTELTRVGVKKERKRNFDQIYAGIYENLYHGKDYPLLKKKKLNELPKILDTGVNGIIAHDMYHWLKEDFEEAVKRKQNTTPTGTCHPFSKRIFPDFDSFVNSQNP